jgi:hypothetical protein
MYDILLITHNALCINYYTLCITYNSLHIMHYVILITYYALCINQYTLCITYYSLCITHNRLHSKNSIADYYLTIMHDIHSEQPAIYKPGQNSANKPSTI